MTAGGSFPAPAQVALFLFLAALCILFPLMPLQFQPDALALPDLLFALIAAWVLRRPSTVPMVLLAAVLLLADFVLGRPVGLWALIGLLASEFLRGQYPSLRRQPFIFEFLTFVVVLTIAFVVQSVVLALALVPQPDGSRLIECYILTVLIYPVVVAVLHFVLHIRAPRPAAGSQRLGRVA